jgi:hypothetical protein
MSALDTKEVTQRVAILKRLKKLLLAQRDKFRTYLDVLEHQETDIAEGDTHKLEAHVELEKSIVKEIYAFQKVIDPLQDMYRMVYPHREEEGEVPAIRDSLERIKEEVLVRNKQNQDLLDSSMTQVRGKIKGLRSLRKLTGIRATESVPSLIDTTA